MDVREKLVELIAKAERNIWGKNIPGVKARRDWIANYLVQNGVTVQDVTYIIVGSKWISVKDRLPEDGQSVLTCKNGICDIQIYEKRRNGWLCKGWFWSMATVTHWMPLPQPPKGENE